MRTGSNFAILVFTIVAVAHFLRFYNKVSITIGDWSVPQWVSILGIIVPGAIVWLLWKER